MPNTNSRSFKKLVKYLTGACNCRSKLTSVQRNGTGLLQRVIKAAFEQMQRRDDIVLIESGEKLASVACVTFWIA